MVSFDAALSIVLEHAEPLGTERAGIEEIVGRFLARPVAATMDMPIFDNAAVDGFGVRAADVGGSSPDSPARLRLAATVRAGDAPGERLVPGAAVKLLTGAPIPEGVEAVVMKEVTEERDGWVLVREAARPGESIRRKAEEFREGDVIVPKGTCITPPVVGLIATFGHDSFEVYRNPSVALVVTGSELARPGEPRGPEQIYDSNSFSLAAALELLGAQPTSRVVTGDDPHAIRQHLARALQRADVVIGVGGVSVGEYDFVKDIYEELGVETAFWKVAIKPGKPFYFGTFSRGGEQRSLVFGLPGNPVAALITFRQLVRPALFKMMGAEDVSPLLFNATLGIDLAKKPGRTEFVRAVAVPEEEGDLLVVPTAGQQSHMLGGLAKANCLIHLGESVGPLSKGDRVQIEFMSW